MFCILSKSKISSKAIGRQEQNLKILRKNKLVNRYANQFDKDVWKLFGFWTCKIISLQLEMITVFYIIRK